MACITPFYKRDKDNEWLQLPCGKCPDCLARRASGWSFRLMQQEKVSDSAHFVTLTYNTDHVPISEKGFMTLVKADLQKFFKRLRKLSAEDSLPIKYYACGEYGGTRHRPHYHVILFNSNPGDVIKAWCLDGKPLGTPYFGTVTGASIGYTLKYITKKGKFPLHANDDRISEFSLMSKGLAATT